MLTLNLLPEQYKKAYIFEIRMRFVVFIFISLAVILVILAALLFSTYLFLKIQTNSFRDSLEAQKKAASAQPIASLEKDIKSLNAKISSLEKAKSEIFPVAPALEKISFLIKRGAYLKSVSLDNETNKVALMGFAATRDLVLNLNSDLLSSDFVKSESVQNPIQNILKDKKIDFSFNFQLSR